MNHPWFKFFPGNWIGDTQLRLCSPAARGLLIDCLCMMHEGKRRGYLETATGRPIDDDMLSRLSGTFKGDVYTLRTELIENGVLSVGSDGVPFSRRMVKDSAKSAKCSEAAVRGGGNPSLKNPSPTENTEDRSHIPNANISLKVPFKGAPKGARKRDAIIDALAMIESSDLTQVTAPAWSKHAKAKQIIMQVAPDVTPEEIAKRAENWKTHYPECGCTSMAIASHWATCMTPKEETAGQQRIKKPTVWDLNQSLMMLQGQAESDPYAAAEVKRDRTTKIKALKEQIASFHGNNQQNGGTR